ncbi:SDR family oxidoreductase [Corynebacterium sp. 320]|uniref:SDR family NAD(P)-dependent oxidoreductase n=1 Tax=Corynebacterium TaxID=1716 RepID=UPI00125CC8F7|nr:MULTISPECIES: SDR family oxidoreductase [Corynebacterium]KAB1504316.1 SDR family oxidoreductase [Corynebacterium sp. 320]KAB1552584.1 SDR family oxidoreductase [Corynebacterium sp. 321]KAB1554198.1 SDR family oxidoreductase [Corynebacterium sp. 319]KAB3528452.1 SDR family oxidoreductase [Corynebacterium sp. 250]KAB3540058.1 SDR family oxidoreductase [Corynebacterium sp. 366]
MDLGLRGRSAIVTGGSKGLGFATAAALVTEGANVAICSRTESEINDAVNSLRETAHSTFPEVPPRVVGYTADVRDGQAVREFVSAAAQDLGAVDILVNNAGGAHPGSPSTITDEAFEADFNIKVLSWQRLIKEALPYLRKSDQPRIINIGSVYGRVPDPGFFSTSVFRAADENLTKTWAAHLASEGILVNLVNIGVIETPQWENIRSKRAPELSMEEFFSKTVSEDIPLRRIGDAQELGDVVTFLASARSSYITGASIDVAGGMGLRF